MADANSALAGTPFAGEESTAQNRERLVLVADPDIEQGKKTVNALAEWGVETILVHDGVEAMMTIQRTLPRAIVIDAALPKMFGFQICEVVKRNESLRDTLVVLVGAIHNQKRYRRPPGEIYGADEYIEQPDLPGGLRPLLEGVGIISPSSEQAAAASQQAAAPSQLATALPPTPEPVQPPMPAPAAQAQPMPEAVAPVTEKLSPPPVVQAPVAVSEEEDERLVKAERLARIVVSDIILYNQEKFEAAVRGGNVVEAMQGDLAEGRSLFNSRIDASTRESRDFLSEELLRVADARSGS
jgi:CheY-like chemotaxis protein